MTTVQHMAIGLLVLQVIGLVAKECQCWPVVGIVAALEAAFVIWACRQLRKAQ